MTDLTATLEAIGKELAGLSAAPAQPEAQDMTLEQFVAYCKSQIDLAKADADPAPRLTELHKQFQIAKAHGWEETDTMSVPVFSGELAVTSQSAHAERLPTAEDSEKNGMGIAVPGPEAAPAGGAFESASGPTGPASNTAKPAARYMPPAFPQSTPAASAEGWMAKAHVELAKSDGGKALLAEFESMLAAEPAKEGDKESTSVAKDEGWPSDCATESFLEGKQAIANEDDFGDDTPGLGRGIATD